MKRNIIIILVSVWVWFLGPRATAALELGVGGGSDHSHYILTGDWEYVDQLIGFLADSEIKNMRASFPCAAYTDFILHGDNIPLGNEHFSNFQIYLNKCQQAGIDVTLLLAYGSDNYYVDTVCPGTMDPHGRFYKLPPQDEIWRLFVNEVMLRFGAQVSGVEIWNEPDLIEEHFFGRVEDYITLFKIAAETIKLHYPSLPVSTGGLAPSEAIIRSYLRALLNPETGVYNQCDAIGLHCYKGRALEVLRTYEEVWEEVRGDDPALIIKPVWMTEFGRHLENDPISSFNSIRGARAFPEHVMEIFSSHGVERAMWWGIYTGDTNSTNLFDWDSEDSTLTPTPQWEFYKDAALKHKDYLISDSIGFGSSDGSEMFGVSPYEEYDQNPENPIVQSAFEFMDEDLEYPLMSHSENGQVLAISFDVNDSWVDEYSSAVLVVEAEILCVGGEVQLRYQSCCETTFREHGLYTDYLNNLGCPEFLEGLIVEEMGPNYQLGVEYSTNHIAHQLYCDSGILTTVTVQLDDWMFQNGLERRADISFVPVDNEPFEIHRIKIYPLENAPLNSVEYTDKSAETQLQYSGQPYNAMPLNYDDDEFKDLFISRYNDNVLAYKGIDIGLSGAPQFDELTPDILPSAIPAGTNGMISADFDNDGWVDFFATSPTNGGRLYRNINGEYYSDWTPQSGLTALLGNNDEVYSCSWADYDGDGFLDLTVILGDPIIGGGWLEIYHNNQGIFESTGLGYASGFTPLWADFDNDGDLDLLSLQSKEHAASEPFSDTNTFLINQGDGTFVNEAWDRIGSTASYGGYDISVVVDFDNDGDLDVVYGQGFGCLLALENVGQDNSNFGYFIDAGHIFTSGSGGRPTDLAVLDYDLDGYQDFIIGFNDGVGFPSPTSVHLLGNRPSSNGGRQFVDETASLNLTGTAPLAGIVPADYNRDGFSDIYLTRASSQDFFFKGKTAANETQNNWVGFSLQSPAGANNITGIGARVEVTAGSETYIQIVDGGSGFASQHEADLVFGLGNYVGWVTVQVTWPNGRVQTQADLRTKQYHTIVDSTPVVDDFSVGFQITYHVNSPIQDWVFTWVTLNDTEADKDKVNFDLSGVPGSCPPGIAEIYEQLSGVDVVITPLGWGKYQHTLTLRNVDCEPRCTIPYTVESATGAFKSVSSSRNIKIKTCVVGP